MKRIDSIFTSLICLLLILSCLSTFSGCQDKNSAENLSTTMADAQTTMADAQTTVADAQTTVNGVNNSESSENTNSAVFYSDEGIILGKDDVPKGEKPDTPVQGFNKEGYVFTGWSVKSGKTGTEDAIYTDKTSVGTTQDNTKNNTKDVTQDSTRDNTQDTDLTLPQVDEDVDYEPNYIDIKDKSNVFALPAVYDKCGETIETKLKLCGKVDLCGFDIQISYDPAILEFISINSDLDLDVVASHDEANHTIKFNCAAAKNRTRTAEVIELSFKIKNAEVAKTRIQLNALEIIAIDADHDNLPVPVPFTLIDGVVYIQ